MRISEKGPVWLSIMEQNMPEAIRGLELRVLMHLTAAACGRRRPSMQGMDSREGLKLYRDFTVWAVKSCSEEEVFVFRENMYRRAFRIGRCLALLPGLKTRQSRKRLIVLLYRNIGIELREAKAETAEKAKTEIKKPGTTKGKTDSPGMKIKIAESGKKGKAKEDKGNTESELWRICIPRCSFSAAYTPKVCHVMSGLDAGIICGILGGGSLKFVQRITEGCPHCSALHVLFI